jgi:hypothetical protein
MSAPSHDEKKAGGMPSPGTVFGLLLAISAGLLLLGIGFSSFIESVGLAKRRYPEVVMGMILIGFIIGAVMHSKKEKKEESGHGGGH